MDGIRPGDEKLAKVGKVQGNFRQHRQKESLQDSSTASEVSYSSYCYSRRCSTKIDDFLSPTSSSRSPLLPTISSPSRSTRLVSYFSRSVARVGVAPSRSPRFSFLFRPLALSPSRHAATRMADQSPAEGRELKKQSSRGRLKKVASRTLRSVASAVGLRGSSPEWADVDSRALAAQEAARRKADKEKRKAHQQETTRRPSASSSKNFASQESLSGQQARERSPFDVGHRAEGTTGSPVLRRQSSSNSINRNRYGLFPTMTSQNSPPPVPALPRSLRSPSRTRTPTRVLENSPSQPNLPKDGSSSAPGQAY